MTEEGWKSEGAAQEYLKIVDVVAPGRKEILTAIARLASEIPDHRPVIMDIGCGWGHVTEEILHYNPRALIDMSDYAEEMVSICKKRFNAYPHITVQQHDLNEGLGQVTAEKYDAVVSCFALHHVEIENRVKLYSDIKKVLKPSGIFVNGDLFHCDSPTIHQWEFNNYIQWMAGQLKEKLGQEYTFDDLKSRQLANYKAMGDKPGTLWNMYKDLKTAGFQFVDCMCKYQNLAVLVASNG